MSEIVERPSTDHRKYTIMYTEEEGGGFSGQCIELPGAISQGETLDELKRNMKEAIQLVLEYVEDKSRSKQVLEILA